MNHPMETQPLIALAVDHVVQRFPLDVVHRPKTLGEQDEIAQRRVFTSVNCEVESGSHVIEHPHPSGDTVNIGNPRSQARGIGSEMQVS
jgi:hypothetical protein